jgi:hypothetical protein
MQTTAKTSNTAACVATVPDNLSKVAIIIHRDWTNIDYGAVPYVRAMATLQSIKDHYYEDSAQTIVRYFLANAGSWRGETARRVKAKLNQLLTHR